MHIVICDDVKEEAEATAACLQDYFQQHNLSLPTITVTAAATGRFAFFRH